jgi:outer membrane receptor protein involved in Fe transport
MKKILVSLILFVCINSFAQLTKSNLPKPGVVSGKVIDSDSKQVLPYVNIVIRDMAKEIITGGITDEKGVFEIKDIPKGKSIVEVQFIGFKIFSREINITNKNKIINLGTIALNEESASLDEVVVRAETSTVVQKVDRKVINVGKDLTAAGTTASELLNNVQSVSVDSQTGEISLRGNNNVRVLVDGKPTNISAAQLLKQIPSTSIKSIELITNPSAKYNPEGMSGIINIILNKNANMGFNGSIDTGITAGHYVRYNTSTNMNYKTGKVNFFGNYGFNGGERYNFGFVERPGINLQDFIFVNDNKSQLLKLGADIYLDDKNTISVYTTQNWFDTNANGSAKISLSNGTLFENSPNAQVSESKNQVYNVNYKHDFDDKGHNIEFETTFSKNDAPNILENRFDLGTQPNYTNDINSIRNNTLVNVDYTKPTENGKIELGLEYRENNTKNTNITTQVGFNNSNFTYERQIYSGYLNYAHKIGKVNMQLGARLEQFDVQGKFNQETLPSDSVTDDIFTIYPSAFFTYNSSEKNQWQISYSKRVDRPSINQVNPIREWSTPLITSVGNAKLVPQFTNSFELNYTREIKGGSITMGTFYRSINDVISRVTFKDPADSNNVRQILTFANLDDTTSYGLEFSTNYKVKNWWRINASMDFYSQKQFGITDINNPNAPRLEVTNEVFNARISNSFKATKNLRFQLFAMYRGPSKDIQWDVENMWMINTGASLTVLKGKGTINFRVNDIFKGMKFAFNSTNPYTQNGKFNWESQTAYLGFNYKFGGGKNKAKRRRNRDNNEKDGGGGFI